MNRKKFLGSLTLLSVLPSAALTKSKDIPGQFSESVKTIKPKRLKEGDTLGIICPGSFITEEELNDTIENISKLGLKAKYSNNVLAKKGYLAGEDKLRTDDLNNMFEDDEVNGIICARGGYGCARILPYIDYSIIKNNPKVIFGYSDITALLIAIYKKTGLVCFHGPVGISTFNEFSTKYFRNVLMETPNELELISEILEEKSDDPAYAIDIISEGSAEGLLTGGNLSIVASLMGTPYEIDLAGKILFLEEVGEEPYRIDRMLTQILMSGNIDKLKGIALGVFSDCESDETNPGFDESFTLKEVLLDRLAKLGIPVIYGLSFGHVSNKFTLPLGVNAKLDTDTKSLFLLESSVQ